MRNLIVLSHRIQNHVRDNPLPWFGVFILAFVGSLVFAQLFGGVPFVIDSLKAGNYNALIAQL